MSDTTRPVQPREERSPSRPPSPFPSRPPSLMTLRVYTANRDGTVVEERAEVRITADDVLPPLMSHTYPPCACPLHRGR